LTTHQLNKLAKRIYPSAIYPYFERKQLRSEIKDEISTYIETHPDTTLEELQQYFNSLDSISMRQELSSLQILKIFSIVGFTIIVLCAVLYLLAGTWEPPTYYLR
jgi:hypothetical protein